MMREGTSADWWIEYHAGRTRPGHFTKGKGGWECRGG